MEVEDWAASSDGTADSDVYLQDTDDEEIQYESGSFPKLQFRKNKSKACWDAEMGMAEVMEKKGRIWTTMGVVRRSKTYCFIEEILYLAQIGALVLLDAYDTVLSLKDICEKVAEGKNGCHWEAFEAYRHLKSLGYIVSRHGVPWTMKSVQSFSDSACLEGITESNEIADRKSEDELSIISLFKDLHINELRLGFDVYLPNSKFRKSCPGDPSFILCLTSGQPPLRAELENLEKKCNGIPLKFCHVDHGRVIYFSFDKVDLPVLP
ncbi:tRNA-splicing endonuclease subunit Sen54-like isoform X1 [Telopea speciosissima]|uniref:tRNA-splicing endonuclease subunit Sen54-like isoform X1 n=1 Tax=Telopea speciosissima TaxID=54955 RepID=UPI001CC401F0|nr:tRNA-splicing endonuclease subunit Sen54-like isoform X1 [Telopea speciosissima]